MVAVLTADPPKITEVGLLSNWVKMSSSMYSANQNLSVFFALMRWSNAVRRSDRRPLSRTALRTWSRVTWSLYHTSCSSFPSRTASPVTPAPDNLRCSV